MLDQSQIRREYEAMQHVWGNDRWHRVTATRLRKFIARLQGKSPEIFQGVILNAGSGGNNYGIKTDSIIHLDITGKNISNLANSIVANIEDIPLESGSVDTILCVGSVLNYSDAFRSISEFSRILRNGGFLILDYEPSNSFEYLGSSDYKADASIISTFFDFRNERIWVYSEKYMSSILNFSGFVQIGQTRIHHLSPLIYKVLKNEEIASRFSIFDLIMKFIPFFNRHSCNLVTICKKINN